LLPEIGSQMSFTPQFWICITCKPSSLTPAHFLLEIKSCKSRKLIPSFITESKLEPKNKATLQITFYCKELLKKKNSLRGLYGVALYHEHLHQELTALTPCAHGCMVPMQHTNWGPLCGKVGGNVMGSFFVRSSFM